MQYDEEIAIGPEKGDKSCKRSQIRVIGLVWERQRGQVCLGMGRLAYKVMIVEPRKRLESVKLVKEYTSVYASITDNI